MLDAGEVVAVPLLWLEVLEVSQLLSALISVHETTAAMPDEAAAADVDDDASVGTADSKSNVGVNTPAKVVGVAVSLGEFKLVIRLDGFGGKSGIALIATGLLSSAKVKRGVLTEARLPGESC